MGAAEKFFVINVLANDKKIVWIFFDSFESFK